MLHGEIRIQSYIQSTSILYWNLSFLIRRSIYTTTYVNLGDGNRRSGSDFFYFILFYFLSLTISLTRKVSHVKS